jgi:hypothetical protein
VIDVRTIHYSIRFAIVLVLTLLFYLGVTLLFYQAVQLPALLTLLFIAVGTERLWVLLEWIGPVVGTMNQKKQEQEQKQIIEYMMECSLRYGSPLVIVAMRGKKRVSLHVVARSFRKSDIVLRSTAGYLLVLMPFTTFEHASIPLKRLTSQLPIKEVVVTDVSMLQTFMEAQGTHGNAEAIVNVSRELRKMCFKAFDIKFADIKARKEKTDSPAIYNLFEPGTSEARFDWLEAFSYSEPEVNALPRVKDESDAIASL